jgi:hypothetical protein
VRERILRFSSARLDYYLNLHGLYEGRKTDYMKVKSNTSPKVLGYDYDAEIDKEGVVVS